VLSGPLENDFISINLFVHRFRRGLIILKTRGKLFVPPPLLDIDALMLRITASTSIKPIYRNMPERVQTGHLTGLDRSSY
jgi:hypothetical protein